MTILKTTLKRSGKAHFRGADFCRDSVRARAFFRPAFWSRKKRRQRRRLRSAGPMRSAITLDINGRAYKATVEPRTTLLDTLRNQLDLTGAKRVCDRGTCGACTVIVDKKVMYSCTILAVDAQGKKIETIEGLAPEGKLHPVSAGVLGSRRAAVRLLHAGLRHGVEGFSGSPSESDV